MEILVIRTKTGIETNRYAKWKITVLSLSSSFGGLKHGKESRTSFKLFKVAAGLFFGSLHGVTFGGGGTKSQTRQNKKN